MSYNPLTYQDKDKKKPRNNLEKKIPELSNDYRVVALELEVKFYYKVLDSVFYFVILYHWQNYMLERIKDVGTGTTSLNSSGIIQLSWFLDVMAVMRKA